MERKTEIINVSIVASLIAYESSAPLAPLLPGDAKGLNLPHWEDVEMLGFLKKRLLKEHESMLTGTLVARGLALTYIRYSRDYVAVEAKAAGAGVWAGDFDLPWDWRRR